MAVFDQKHLKRMPCHFFGIFPLNSFKKKKILPLLSSSLPSYLLPLFFLKGAY